jgi:transketolase
MQYPILADLGYFPESELDKYATDGGMLANHSHKTIPGVDWSGGSLGIGLGVAAGLAYNAKLDGSDYVVFVVIGDGECHEGSIWETAMFAAHNGLDNLVAVLDRNRLASTVFIDEQVTLQPIAEKWRAFGWDEIECDGHDVEKLLSLLKDVRSRKNGKPLIIIADTIKGKGIDYMENALFWHAGVPKGEKADSARAQISGEAVTR